MTDWVGRQLGNYRLHHLLGRGAFAAVYLGEHLYLERLAAIKVLQVQIEPATHDAFRHEARTIAHLDHFHIVRVFDFGIADQTPYLVMEYTPNGTLRTQHPKGTRLSLEQIVSYVKQIALALDYAHEQHVIHRDVKPENLLLNAKGEIVLSDFGIAIVQRTLDTLSGQNMAGTPLYMAPEQIQRQPCPASDQYALAVMVYEWLCGEPPFPGPGAAIFGQHLTQSPPSLCACVPSLPPAVEDTVFGALAKDPTQRFISVQDFATALEEACFATQILSTTGTVEHISAAPLTSASDTLPVPVAQVPQPILSSQQIGGPLPLSAGRGQARSVVSICALEDGLALEQWETHLRPLEQAGIFSVWSERHLLAGASRQLQIGKHLNQADVIVLLVSADFFASNECVALMQRALSRLQHEGTPVVPLLLRSVEWQVSPLASLSCIPSNRVPIMEWANRDAAFESCARDIYRLLGQPIPSTQKFQQTRVPLSQAQRNRQILLRRVRSVWIEGVLKQSLHGAALIALGLQEQPEAVANPWHLVLHHPATAPQPLPSQTRITQVYDEVDGGLLILGAPGAGKTTLLLELAQDLLDRAERDEQYPLPVVFNLSSWALEQQPLTDWLIEELTNKYQVPRKLGQALVAAEQILPLLDGLDEVIPSYRSACIEAVNGYRQEYGLQSLVVCCRSADYQEQTMRVQLESAVMVQPLTESQVDDYLASGGEPLRGLQMALHQDSALCELASTPLMLSILTISYHHLSVEALLHKGSLEMRRRHLFETYVQRALHHQGNDNPYRPQETIRWLSWLASQLQQRGQTVFYLERMQPDWLPRSQRVLLLRFITGLVYGLFFALMIGLKISTHHISGMNILGDGLAGGLFFGVLNSLLAVRKITRTNTSGVAGRWWRMLQVALIIVLNGSLSASWEWIENVVSGTTDPSLIVSSSIPMGLLGGVIFALLYGLFDGRITEIQPIEQVSWSWTNMVWNALKSLYIGVFCGLLVSLLFGFLTSLYTFVQYGGEGPLAVYLPSVLNWAASSAWLLVPLCGGLGGFFGGLSGGLSGNTLDERNLLKPNQGIRRSALMSLCVGFICTLIVGFSAGLCVEIYSQIHSQGAVPLSTIVICGLVIGMLSGLACGLRYGGIACMQHVVLRWLLWRANSMPWNCPRFLDDAARRILLRKVGGGYVFVHRLLLEYFTSLSPAVVPTEEVAQRSPTSPRERVREQATLHLRLEPTSHRSFSSFISRGPKGPYVKQHRFSRRKGLLWLTVLTGFVIAGGSSFWWFLLPHPLSTLPGQAFSPQNPYQYTVVWSPDGKRVNEIAQNGTVKVLNAGDGSHYVTTRRRSHDQYHDIDGELGGGTLWSPDNTRIASVTSEGRVTGVVVQVWNMQAGGHVSTYQEPFYGSSRFVRAMAWSPDGKHLALLDTNGTVQIRDTANEKQASMYQITSLKLGQTDPGDISLAWSPDGKHLAAADDESETIQIWNAANGSQFYQFAYQAGLVYPSVTSMAWSPDGKRLALGYMEGIIQVRDAVDGRTLLAYRGHIDIPDIAWSPNGKFIASAGSEDQSVQIRDASNGNLIHFYWLYPHGASQVVWSPDGKYLAVGGLDGTVQVWKAL